jgi:hypothetical protein
MSNIEYHGIPCLDDTEIRYYRRVGRNKAKRLTERYNKNKSVIAEIDAFERQEQENAFAAYRKMRAERKYRNDKDVLLFHLDMRR